ncbi:MAG: ABC transporter permease [Dehalococcoidia bacterium]|jgi:ABC-2 type transport system permease protein
MKTFNMLLMANAKQFVREKAALFWTFLFPIFFILIFGAVFSGNMEDVNFNVGLVVEDDSAMAQNMSAALGQVNAFKVTEGQRDDEIQALQDGDRRAVLVIEQGFGATIAQGGTANVSVYYDPTQTSSVQILLPIVQKVVDNFDRALSGSIPRIHINEETLQSYSLRSIDYLVPGILAMSLMQLGLFGVAQLVVDRENKVLKRLGATPLRRSTMIMSTVVFNLIVAMLQAALIIIIARLVFGVPIMGNWFYLIGFIILGTLTFLAMGYMLSAFAKNQQTLMPLIMAVQFPMMFLSGIFFPLEMMPGFMRPIMDAMPLTYLADSVRQIMVESSAMHSHIINLAVLGVWFVVCLVLAVRFFKWE